jgi:hypothetical protein
MAICVEWRLNQGEDAIVIVDQACGDVTEVMTPDPAILKDSLP